MDHRQETTQSPDAAGRTGAAGEGGSGDPVAALAAATTLLDSLAGTDWGGLTGSALHAAIDHLEQLSRRTGAVRARVIAAAETEGSWALDGQRSFAAWLRDRTCATPAGAQRQVRTARALRDLLPQSKAALATGLIGEDHVAVLLREATKTSVLRNALADPSHGEAFLLPMAQSMDAGQFNRAVKSWAIRVDPDGADRAWREAGDAAEVTLAQTTGGWHLSGWLDEHGGQLLEAALRAFHGRRGADDTRSYPQGLADALVAMAGHALDTGDQAEHAQVRPHVSVTVPWETLERLSRATATALPRRSPVQGELTGPMAGGDGRGEAHEAGSSGAEAAWVTGFAPGDDQVISTRYDRTAMVGAEPAAFDDGTPIPHGLLARIACSSQLARIVFGPDSTILDSGREVRIFTAAQSRAIIARDRHCQYPRCQEPPGRSEIHHSLWWGKHQGPTSTDHGILLCWHHHTLVHAREIDIARLSGRWIFTDRNGRRIGEDRYQLSG